MKKLLFFPVLVLSLIILVWGISYSDQPSADKNPFAGNQDAVKEGAEIFALNCRTCHGDDAKGNMCPDITVKNKKFGNSDAELFKTISKGVPGGMPNWNDTLGNEKIWKVITFLRTLEE